MWKLKPRRAGGEGTSIYPAIYPSVHPDGSAPIQAVVHAISGVLACKIGERLFHERIHLQGGGGVRTAVKLMNDDERRQTTTNDDKRRQRRTMVTRSVPRSPDNSCRASARVIDPAAAVNRGRYVHCEV